MDLSLPLFELGPGRMVVRGGARVSHFGAHAPEVPGIGDVDYGHTGFVGSAVAEWEIRGAGGLWLGFHQGFRAPNLQESTVLGDTGSKFEVPNGSLGPERSDTLELGGRYRKGRLALEATAFFSWLDDMISERELSEAEWRALGLDPQQVGDKPVVQRVNSKQGRIWGAEGSLRIGPWGPVSGWAQLAWLRGEEVRDDGTVVPARRIPPLFGRAGIRYQPQAAGWYLEGWAEFAGRQTRLHPSDLKDLRICEDPANPGDTYGDSGKSCPGTPAWVTLNLAAHIPVSERLAITILVANLADARYKTHGSGVYAPGFDLSVLLSGDY